MDKKIFFLDLDGTTLADDKSVPDENIKAVGEALDAGHYIVINTGRATSSAMPYVKQLDIFRKGCYMVSFNGAAICDLSDMSPIRNLKLPDECVTYLFAEAKKRGFHIQAYDEGEFVLTETENPHLEYYIKKTGMHYRVVPDLAARGHYDTPKVIVIDVDSHERLEEFKAEHAQWEAGRCTSFFSDVALLEYCRPDATKAAGVAFFEDYLGVSHENTIALGDEGNDLPMIGAAGIGYAMANAPARIRNQVSHITQHTNNEAGVAEIIRQYI
ncbi:MAG: Cof-type HAD-IIB family hydrolase [Clostridiales bacterium]|nr:Cof-type HAD-IIB family hydrolase [Clostridiales bacterium]